MAGNGTRAIMARSALAWLLMAMQYSSEMADAAGAVYTVGDDQGWTYNVSFWPIGKTFHVDDTLVFKYNSSEQNVVIVDKVGYNWCIASSEDSFHNTGKDEIKLLNGTNYFISNLPTHCQMGVKLAVTATPPS